MNDIIRWTGFICIMGVVGIGAISAWWYVLTKILDCMKETWWIASYAMWKRGNRKDAHKVLEIAIRSEKNWKEKYED